MGIDVYLVMVVFVEFNMSMRRTVWPGRALDN